MKQIFITGIILLLSLGKSFAQLNESDTLRFQLRAGVTGAYQQGNVVVLNVKSKLDFVFRPNLDWVFKSQNSSLYQAFYSKKADNDVFSRNYLYYKPQRTLYPFAIAYLSANFRRKIDRRYFAGAGATYRVLNREYIVLKLSASAVYETTNFRSNTYNYKEYNGQDNINLWRGTVYVGGWIYAPDKHLRLYYDAFWQPAFTNGHNYRAQADVGVDFPIWKGLSFNAVYAYTHENVVVTNIRQDDTLLTFGLSYSFRKKRN